MKGRAAAAVTLAPEELERAIQVDRLLATGPAGIPGLMAMLDDRSWTVRRGVVAALSTLGPEAVAALCAALQHDRRDEARIAAVVDALATSLGEIDEQLAPLAEHPNPAVLADVAQILGRRRTVAGVAALVKLARHPDDNVAVGAIEALGRAGGRAAVDTLIESLQSGNFFRVFPAMDVLGRSGDPRAVGPLAALLTPEGSLYRAEAARALGRTGERTALPALTRLLGQALQAGSAGDMRLAATALQELHGQLLRRYGDANDLALFLRRELANALTPDGAGLAQLRAALPTADAAGRGALAFLLGVLGDVAAAPTLLALLGEEGPSATAAAEALRRLALAEGTHLSRILRQAEGPVRRSLLPFISRADAAADVVAVLDDADPEVRALACQALGRIGHTSAVPHLTPRLGDASGKVVFAATAALQSLGSGATEQAALAAATSSEPGVRRAALRILAYFGYPSALAVFLRAVEDADPRVQESGIQGLAFVDDRRALEALLVEAAPSSSPRAGGDAAGASRRRGLALRALGKRGQAGPLVAARLMTGFTDPDPWVRYYACQAAGALALDEATPALVACLGDAAGQVRVAAVEALSRLGSATALAALRKAVEDAEGDIQRAALVGLGVAGDAASLPILTQAAASAGEAATRLVALSALAAFDSPSVLAALEQAVDDPAESVRTAAVGLLAARPGRATTTTLLRWLAHPDAELQARAGHALATPAASQVDDRIAGLLEALERADDDLAAHVAAALVRMRSPAAIAALVGAMALPNARARKAVASALAVVATPESLAALLRAAEHDPEREVRDVAALVARPR